MCLQEKIVIITGAGRGIGEACARLCLSEGARVALISRTTQEVEAAARRLDPAGENTLALTGDVGDEQAVADLFNRVAERWSGLDGLVNCAAIFRQDEFSRMPLEHWNEVLRVNLTGTFLTCREAFRRLTTGGAIVNISSLSGVPGVEKFPGFAAYNVSKYGVLGLTEILAVEGQPRGIRVNCVSPGAVDTAMLKQAAPDLPPVMRPEEVAETVVFLLSGRAGAINGANIILSGSPRPRAGK